MFYTPANLAAAERLVMVFLFMAANPIEFRLKTGFDLVRLYRYLTRSRLNVKRKSKAREKQATVPDETPNFSGGERQEISRSDNYGYERKERYARYPYLVLFFSDRKEKDSLAF